MLIIIISYKVTSQRAMHLCMFIPLCSSTYISKYKTAADWKHAKLDRFFCCVLMFLQNYIHTIGKKNLGTTIQ